MKKKINDFLKKQFRIVLINDNTLEEEGGIRLSRTELILYIITFVLLFFVGSFFVIVYSPINQHLPGKSSEKVQKELLTLSLKSDSLERALYVRSLYLSNIEAVIKGDTSIFAFSEDTSTFLSQNELSFAASKEDSSLRARVEREDLGTIDQNINKETAYFLFYPPLEGMISDSFNFSNDHFAVDLVAKKGTKIKAVSGGTVIVGNWNPETGYVIGVQHQNNFISFYKHCSKLLKTTGDVVETGEHIAIIGNTGELSTGPHLHFELWQNGIPLNPANYISF